MFISKNVVTGVEDGAMKAPPGSENILDLPVAVGFADGHGLVRISKWTPSEEERKQIAEGGSVYLWIVGNLHPPVYVSGNEPTVLGHEDDIPVFALM